MQPDVSASARLLRGSVSFDGYPYWGDSRGADSVPLDYAPVCVTHQLSALLGSNPPPESVPPRLPEQVRRRQVPIKRGGSSMLPLPPKHHAADSPQQQENAVSRGDQRSFRAIQRADPGRFPPAFPPANVPPVTAVRRTGLSRRCAPRPCGSFAGHRREDIERPNWSAAPPAASPRRRARTNSRETAAGWFGAAVVESYAAVRITEGKKEKKRMAMLNSSRNNKLKGMERQMEDGMPFVKMMNELWVKIEKPMEQI